MSFDLAIIRTALLISKDSDKNGLQPILLEPIAGIMPSKRTISGTLAVNSGFEPNQIYLVQITEGKSNEYGRNFNFANLGKLSPIELLQNRREFGAAKIVDVSGIVEATSVTAFSNVADPALV